MAEIQGHFKQANKDFLCLEADTEHHLHHL